MQKRHNDPNFKKKLRHNEGALQLLLPPLIDSLRFRFRFDSIQIFIHSFVAERCMHGMAWHGCAKIDHHRSIDHHNTHVNRSIILK